MDSLLITARLDSGTFDSFHLLPLTRSRADGRRRAGCERAGSVFIVAHRASAEMNVITSQSDSRVSWACLDRHNKSICEKKGGGEVETGRLGGGSGPSLCVPPVGLVVG